MIKRFPNGTAKPFLTPSEYAELRDDDRFLYNEGTNPSARITGDKGRENPAEGAPYGEGLIGRITALEAREAELVDAGTFLLARLDELEWLDGQLEDTARDYMGHVDPAVDRFRATLAKHQEGEG